MPVVITQRCHLCEQMLPRSESFDTWLQPGLPDERRRVWDRYCHDCRTNRAADIKMLEQRETQKETETQLMEGTEQL